MQITEALLKRFFANDCTVEEADAVYEYLKSHPDIADEYLESSWKETDGSGNLPGGYKEEMLYKIRMAITGSHQSRNKKFLRSLAIAASVLLLIATTWLLFPKKPDSSKAITITKREEDKPLWQIRRNLTDTSVNIVLDDGSTIILSPHAMVKYLKPFADNKRDFYLEGEAFFEVSKNESMPFTVYSCSFSTTALGTSFRVSEKSTGCTVNLYTGKVVVKATSKLVKGWNGNVYLLPGQQLQYDATKNLVVINKKDKKKKTGIIKGQPAVGEKGTEELVFDNTPLRVVMDRISEKYHLVIEYNKKDIAGMYFTGSVLQNDSISVILKAIGQMNGLVIMPNEKGYLVQRSQ